MQEEEEAQVEMDEWFNQDKMLQERIRSLLDQKRAHKLSKPGTKSAPVLDMEERTDQQAEYGYAEPIFVKARCRKFCLRHQVKVKAPPSKDPKLHGRICGKQLNKSCTTFGMKIAPLLLFHSSKCTKTKVYRSTKLLKT